MTLITSIPREVLACILRSLDDVASLLPAILTCRHLHQTFRENAGIAFDILQRQMAPDLLPYSIAVRDARQLSRPYTTTSIQSLLETLDEDPKQLELRARALPLRDLIRMESLNNIVKCWTEELALNAWTLLSQNEPGVSGYLNLSPTEHFRFCRAFYRVELYFNVFRREGGDSWSDFELEETRWFFSRYPPWENEQLACVHDFLENKMLEAAFDAVAHDVEFGEYCTDYLSTGSDNLWSQHIISQGAEFLDKLSRDSSFEGKCILLKSRFGTRGTQFHMTLSEFYNDLQNQKPLDDYEADEIEALVPQGYKKDTDNGSFVVWRASHGYLPRGAWVFFSATTRLRECAYVLWDMNRIERDNMLEIFESMPEEPSHAPSEEEFDEMQKSFDERSKVWRKSGRGYWSKDDTGRINWL